MAVHSIKLTSEQQTKLDEVIAKLPSLIASLEFPEYDEIYGYRINEESLDHVDVDIRDEILLKFLAADDYDVEIASERIKKTLEWRATFRPLEAAYFEEHDEELGTLGAITSFPDAKDGFKTTTWNLYGAIKLPKKLFAEYAKTEKVGGNIGQTPFLRWRIGLMEKALANIDFKSSNNRIAQIHDYEGALMFRMDSGMKTATKSIVDIFGSHYPELLSHKFFVNVPYIMGWVYPALCALGIILAETAKKLTMQSHGDVKTWFPVADLPEKYGGSKKVGVHELEAKLPSEPPAYGRTLIGQEFTKKQSKVETPAEVEEADKPVSKD